jgi:TRAP-type C4-dicarboxylate transport system permease small subunit
MRVLKWLDDRFEETAMTLLLALITIIMGYSIIRRYGFNDSLSWAEEVCRIFFVYSAFLSAPLCLKKRSSVKIDMLILTLPPLPQKLVLIAGDALMFAFFSYMLDAAWGVAVNAFRTQQTSPALLIPMHFIFASAVLSFALCLIRIAERLYFLLTTPGAGYQAHLDAGRGSAS